MPPLKDLTNKRFNKLKVIKREGTSSPVKWLCECECGSLKVVTGGHLTTGHTKSCGCLVSEAAKEQALQYDLVGKRFDSLLVIKRMDKRAHRAVIYKCLCDCGKEVEINGESLRQRLTTSCGCIRYSIGEKNIVDILEMNNIEYKREYKFDNLISNKGYQLRFDFAVFNKNKEISQLIEFDGRQHYENTGWGSIDLQERDKIKNQYCKDNNIKLVRIPYTLRDKITLELLEL